MGIVKLIQPELFKYNNNNESQRYAEMEMENTFYSSYIEDTSYKDLIEILGEPTFENINLESHKIWVLIYRDNVIIIKDYKSGREEDVVLYNENWRIYSKGLDCVNISNEFSGYISYIKNLYLNLKQFNIKKL
jgi:hypothetical protein